MPTVSGSQAGVELPAPPSMETSVDAVQEQDFEELLALVREARPKDDLAPIEKAYRFASQYHAGQTRASGEPYMSHPVAVSKILAGMRMDVVSIETGLLHDVVEDTSVTTADVQKNFGDEVARCVDGVTKLSKINFFSAEDRQAESYRKMLLAMVNDIRVIIVKLADRLHNMRTLDSLSPERRERIARETLEIYAPIAHRLGMGKVRGELEDLAFRHLDPEAFAEISRTIDTQRAANEEYLERMRRTLEAELRREGIPARVEARVKRAYSVYQKLKRQKISIEQVYDLLALRVITDSVKNCYGALGVIHNEWSPVPGRIKDFIAIPRPNLYQSLHTSVVGPEGRHFEIQIRTDEMHRIAEEGIAAHWKYKEGKRGVQDDQRVAWLRQLVEWQQDMRDPGEFMSTLKVDLYPEEVYCFTPKGRVIVLPAGSCPIDFAYAVHSEVGNTCTGAKVNGRIVPLRYVLRNGDIVDVLTQTGHEPSKDWLSIVKTSRARNKIKHIINENERERAIEIGQKMLEKEARRLGVQIGRIQKTELERVAAEYGLGKAEDLYASLGYGKFSARQVLQKSAPEQVAAEPAPAAPVVEPAPSQGRDYKQKDDDAVIKVHGVDDVMVYRAKCCNPIKGEGIVGYVTRGKGIAVHSRTCPNVQNLMYDAERKIEVDWARNASDSFPVRIVVHTDDRPGLLHQLTSVLSDENSNVRSLEAKTDVNANNDAALVEMTVDVRDKKQLEKLCSAMRRISGVRDVERLVNQ
ncbi:MAG TPA: bifunctional (p)ppGpp synthetase/guanosine-3',5'-bis(diphosphate) 3'-pyrophosphohydrolase [Bryobacteraceae bacterium]|nr:bifunctional (p)ppGpp synthetase/guanosine-3',5'-bis(diphosphate) 3'-pyrophosphohydrolase [Bryobacteraceae bacterium]